MVEEETTDQDEVVCSSKQSGKEGSKRGILSKEFSEEECVLILEDETFEQVKPTVCEVTARQTVKLFKEYQGEDYSHYLPDPIDPIDCSRKSTKISGSRIIKRRRSSSAMPDLKEAAATGAAATSKPCRQPPTTPPSRPKHGLRHLLRHLANSLPPKKRTNKIASSSGGIHAFSFTDSKIGCPYQTDSSDVLPLHNLEPDIRFGEGLSPVDNRMFVDNGSVTSRRSSHSNNFTLVSRRSQSVSDVIAHVASDAAALQTTPTCQSKSTGAQATPISQYGTTTHAALTHQRKSTASQTTPTTCQLISHRCSGTQEYPDHRPDGVKAEADPVKESSLWKRILTTFQKGVDHQRRSYRRPLVPSNMVFDITDN